MIMNPGPGRLAVSQPSSTFNSTATYSCQSVGYNIDGDIQRTCGADGSYSGSEPTCTREYIYIYPEDKKNIIIILYNVK